MTISDKIALTEESSLITEGSVSVTAIAFLQAAVLRMIPYAMPSLVLIALDLIYGIAAARSRGERVRLSTAIRRTTTKVFTYICWIVLASTLALAFETRWVEWVVLGAVYLNEIASVVGNYYESKGIRLKWGNILNSIIHIFGKKHDLDVDGVDTNEFTEPIARPRDSKGRFVKKS